MKKLILAVAKPFVKGVITADRVKRYIHEYNMHLAMSVELDGKRLDVANVVGDCVNVGDAYIGAFKNDGRIDDDELALCNERCDKVVDKYIPQSRIDAFVDWLFAKLGE